MKLFKVRFYKYHAPHDDIKGYTEDFTYHVRAESFTHAITRVEDYLIKNSVNLLKLELTAECIDEFELINF